jgi:hypothetical protein
MWALFFVCAVAIIEPHAGAQQQRQEAAEAAPESQLALLPVHVHRSPCKRGAQPAAAAFSKRREGGSAGYSNSSASSSTASLDSVSAAGQAKWQLDPQPRCVPVLTEAQQQPQKVQPGRPQPPVPLPFPAPPSQRAGAGAAAPAGPAGSSSCSSSGEEEEGPVCSVCLDSFEDGAKVREGGLAAW